MVPTFDPEPVIAHCFKQFKQNFRLPQSRRRIFIVPAQGRPRQGQAPVDLMPQPPPPPPPVPSFRGLDLGDSPGPLEDRVAWLHQRARLRKELEALDDVARWLENKPSISPLEAKVLRMLHKEREVQIMSQAEVTTATKVSGPTGQVSHCRFKHASSFCSCGLVRMGMLLSLSQRSKWKPEQGGILVSYCCVTNTPQWARDLT